MVKASTIMIVALLVGSMHTGAEAQGVGGTFPGVAPSVPAPGSGPPPPAIAPGPAGPVAPGLAAPVAPGPAAPRNRDPGGQPRVVTVPGLPPVIVPRGPAGRNGYSDRVERCIHYGTAAGVPINEMNRFTAYCAR